MGGMNNGKITFKEYNMNQSSLLPPNPEELIPKGHLGRVVNGGANSNPHKVVWAKKPSLNLQAKPMFVA